MSVQGKQQNERFAHAGLVLGDEDTLAQDFGPGAGESGFHSNEGGRRRRDALKQVKLVKSETAAWSAQHGPSASPSRNGAATRHWCPLFGLTVCNRIVA